MTLIKQEYLRKCFAIREDVIRSVGLHLQLEVEQDQLRRETNLNGEGKGWLEGISETGDRRGKEGIKKIN